MHLLLKCVISCFACFVAVVVVYLLMFVVVLIHNCLFVNVRCCFDS